MVGSFGLFAGILANEVLNIVLKRWFAEPRPIGSAKAGFGLPSSHSQLMFFVVVFIAMWLYCSQRVTLDHHLHKHLLVALLVGSSVIVAFSRFDLQRSCVRPAFDLIRCAVLCAVCIWAFIPLSKWWWAVWSARWSALCGIILVIISQGVCCLCLPPVCCR